MIVPVFFFRIPGRFCLVICWFIQFNIRYNCNDYL